MDPSMNPPLVNNVDPSTTPATITTTLTAPTVASTVPHPLQGFVTAFGVTINLTMNVGGFFVNVTNGGMSFVVVSVTPAGTNLFDANATAPPASARRVRDGGGAVMAISELLFPPTLFLMLTAAITEHTTITTDPVLDTFGNHAATYILFIAAVLDVAAAAFEALGITLSIPPYTEATASYSAVNFGKYLVFVARGLASVAVILFVLGARSLLSEYSLLGIGAASDVSSLIK